MTQLLPDPYRILHERVGTGILSWSADGISHAKAQRTSEMIPSALEDKILILRAVM